MKLFETEHSFNYSWDQVTAANWQKYPNELLAHVVLVDILSRSIDVERKTLRTERLISCKQGIPSWLRYLVGTEEFSFVREVSEVDLINKTLVMKSSNLTMNHLLLVNETIVYKPDNFQPLSKTSFKQEAEITAFGSFKRVCEKLEEWGVDRFQQNALKGKQGFESVLEVLTEKWEKSGVFVNEVGDSIIKEVENVRRDVENVSDSIIKDIEEVSGKTQGILAKVAKLGNAFKRD